MTEIRFSYPDGVPACGAEPPDREGIRCALPGAEPYKTAWHIMFGGHVGRRSEAHTMLFGWADDDKVSLALPTEGA